MVTPAKDRSCSARSANGWLGENTRVLSAPAREAALNKARLWGNFKSSSACSPMGIYENRGAVCVTAPVDPSLTSLSSRGGREARMASAWQAALRPRGRISAPSALMTGKSPQQFPAHGPHLPLHQPIKSGHGGARSLWPLPPHTKNRGPVASQTCFSSNFAPTCLKLDRAESCSALPQAAALRTGGKGMLQDISGDSEVSELTEFG